MQALKPFTPTMIGGAADLVESTKTEFEGAGLFSATHAGRNIAFGIREHAMGSIVNGIALDAGDAAALRLDLPDLLRLHAPRRAALRAHGHLQSAWVWTHDSVAVGEDGPTHQPVEHHMALRAIPNLWYVRPADANETAMAWRIALERRGRPGGARALAPEAADARPRRGRRPPRARSAAPTRSGSRGEGLPDVDPDRDRQRGRTSRSRPRSRSTANVRVVSMPCWELFAEQPQDYRDEVLPPDVRARLSVEAGVSLGWER